MDITTIGSRIAELRKEKKITQEELAGVVGVSAQAVSKWERGGVPDTELLPAIADYFGVTIDRLFGRELTDPADVDRALVERIAELPQAQRIKAGFEACWTIERAMFGKGGTDSHSTVEDILTECGTKEKQELYSSVQFDSGYTCMGIGRRMQYFLIVPDAPDKQAALFDGIDYPGLFKTLSDREVFDALLMLYRRDHHKAFTLALLVKKLGVTVERAEEIIDILKKLGHIYTTQLEVDDEIQKVYSFVPKPSFPALLIFAREMIHRPQHFAYHYESRNNPYL